MGLGFKQAGFRLAGSWDFDKYAVESYANNVSPKVKQADITQMTAAEVPYADVWTFGFPCQDLSVAGKQAGMIKGKTRSGLFYEVMRLLEETNPSGLYGKPKIIMAENVKGLKPYLNVLEEEYDAVGYKMYYTIYNSKYWGVPQNRERYFVVGVRKDIDKEFVFPTQQTDFIPKLSSVLESEVDEKYYIDDLKATKIIEQAMERIELKNSHACITPDRVDKRKNGRRAKDNEEEMFTLTSQDLHGVIQQQPKIEMLELKIPVTVRKYPVNTETLKNLLRTHKKKAGLSNKQIAESLNQKITLVEHWFRTDECFSIPMPEVWLELKSLLQIDTDEFDLSVMEFIEVNGEYDQANRIYQTKGISPTLTVAGEVKIIEQPKIEMLGLLDMKGNETVRRVYDPEGLSPTLTTSEGGHRQPKILEKYRVRKLTPREYARLQGFPDSYKQVVSNSQFYKQMGNAVTVNVAQALAEQIKTFLEEK